MRRDIRQGRQRIISVLGLLAALSTPAWGQMFWENFDTVSGIGGGPFLIGRSAGATLVDWDTGLSRETAFGFTTGLTLMDLSAAGLLAGGVDGSGAGQLSASNVRFDLIDENFFGATGTGGGVFGIGDPNLVSASAFGWDDGIVNEQAFFAVRNGAVLFGDVAASAVLNGGNPGAAGQLVVNDVDVASGDWFAGLSFQIPGFPASAVSVLRNASFEEGEVGSQIASWTEFGTVGPFFCPCAEGSGQTTPRTGSFSVKLFSQSQAPAPDNASGLFQDLVAVPGQTWELDVWARHNSGFDNLLDTDNTLGIRIEFLDSNGVVLSSTSAEVLNEASPQGVWIDVTPLQAVSPAGTVTARAILEYINGEGDLADNGAAFFDDASFTVVDGPSPIDLSQFSLLADVRGDANGANGEVFGHVQLRLEDDAGARLVFESPAVMDGNWMTLGGPLDPNFFVELDANSVPAPGAFNPGSSSLTVVVAFDNDRAPVWGSGGTLEVDNLFIENTTNDDSEYAAGVFFAGIPATTQVNPDRLFLGGDLLGSVAGGEYQLRAELFTSIPTVNEDFDSVVGRSLSASQILFPDGSSGFTDNLDAGIGFAFASAGAEEAIVTTPDGGAWVSGQPGGGNPGGALRIEAHQILFGLDDPEVPGPKWFVTAGWGSQRLASTDLSQVSLTADVRGMADPLFLEQLGTVVLRIEDPEGDFVGFEVQTNGSWQSIGGPLSTANVSGSSTGQGDGVFDSTLSGDYTVIIAIEGRPAPNLNWNAGGILDIDNVQLTAVPFEERATIERGRLIFSGQTDGAWQSVGGIAGMADSTFATIGGVVPSDIRLENWDVGIEGEVAFTGGSTGTVTAQGCLDCGVDGGGGAELSFKGVSGQYFTGFAWDNVPISFAGGRSDVSFTMDLRAIVDPNLGETLGTVVIRLEDALGDPKGVLSWSEVLTSNYQTIGGPLNDPTWQDSGAQPFNESAGVYTVVLLVVDQVNPTFGTGGIIEVDNVSIIEGGSPAFVEDFATVTGPRPGFLDENGEIDVMTVAVTMENGVSSWGGDASLTIDNLLFSPLPISCDLGTSIDMIEVARLQQCAGLAGTDACDCSDVDGSGLVDGDDWMPFELFVAGP